MGRFAKHQVECRNILLYAKLIKTYYLISMLPPLHKVRKDNC